MQHSKIPVYFVSSYDSVCCSLQFSLSLGSTMYFVLVIKKMLRYIDVFTLNWRSQKFPGQLRIFLTQWNKDNGFSENYLMLIMTNKLKQPGSPQEILKMLMPLSKYVWKVKSLIPGISTGISTNGGPHKAPQPPRGLF